MSEKTNVSPRIVENHAGQACYLVEYDEDQWLKYDKEGQEFCFETWAKKAKPLGAVFVVLRLVPDPLFPSGEKTTPYIFRSYPVEQETFNPIQVNVNFSARIDPDVYKHATDGERMQLISKARQDIAMHAMATSGCTYDVHTLENGAPKILTRGRV